MQRLLRWVLVVVVLTALVLPIQALDLNELLSGKELRMTMQLKDLNSDWIRVSVGDQSGIAGLQAAIYSSMMGGSGGTGAYYTKGETVLLAGERWLVAYQIRQKPFDYSALMSSERFPTPAKPTPETIVSLSFLNLSAISALNDIRPFDLQKELQAAAGPIEAIEESSEKAKAASSLSNLQQLGLALLMYCSDYDEVLPKAMGKPDAMQKALYPYTKNNELFKNPMTGTLYLSNAILAKKKVDHIKYPSQMVTFYESEPASDGTRGVAFLDGHAKRLTASEWASVKKTSKIP
jgi:hypothetical protein